MSGRHYRLHRNCGRVRTSYSLNRINEIHESELTDHEEEGDQVTHEAVDSDMVGGTSDRETVSVASRSRRQFTPQLSSESEGEPPGASNEILTRYLLDTLGRSEARQGRQRSDNTEDSLNSSDSEYNTEEDRRRNKVNLRQLEERLNMIQEECNRSDDGESDDERSATIDDRSERNEPMDILDDSEINECRNKNGEEILSEDEDLQTNDIISSHQVETVFSKIDQLLDNSKYGRKSSVRSRSEGWTFSDGEDAGRRERGRTSLASSNIKNVASTRGRPRSAPPRHEKKLYRAHRYYPSFPIRQQINHLPSVVVL